MTNVTVGTGRRPCSKLGDQQLLDQTRRLAANQRALEVHIVDHLDEIDRRGLALRRGFSSLFDYAVRELLFSDAAAQRRIQTMRLCRRHGWVRARLQSGTLSLTATAQMETAFAAAERQYRKAMPLVGEQHCHDLLALAASPGEAGARDGDEPGAGVASAAAMTACAPHGVVAVALEARSPRDAGGHADRHAGSGGRGPSSDEPAAVDARPGAAGSQPAGRFDSSAATSGAARASTPVGVPGRPEANFATPYARPHVAPGRASWSGLAGIEAAHTSVAPVTSHAASQHRGTRHADALTARLESNGAASLSEAPSRASGFDPSSSDQGTNAGIGAPGVPLEELGTAAPLPPPASRAASAPVPVVAASKPRPTVPPAPAPSRGEPKPRQLKGLLSHVDPHMSWGDLVARLVREAVARHDPRGGGRKRKCAGSKGDSSRRERTRTPDAVPAAAPAGGGGAAPTAQGESAVAGEQPRATVSPSAAPVRGSAPTAPAPAATPAGATASGTRAGTAALAASDAAVARIVESHPTRSATEPASAAPDAAAAPEGQRVGARVPCAAPRLPASGAPRLTVPATPSGALESAAAPQLASSGPADGADASPVPPATPPAPELAGGVPLARGAGGAQAGALPRSTRDAPRGPRQPPVRRTIPAAVRRHVWLRDGGRCRYRDPLTGRRCNSSHLLQIDHLLPVAEGGGPEPDNLALTCFAHHRMRHGHGPVTTPEPSR